MTKVILYKYLLYTVIYDNIKQQLNTNGDLVFVNDL